MYQARQFGVGNLAPTPNRVADYLEDPPQALLDAQAVTPLTERAYVATHPQAGIVPN